MNYAIVCDDGNLRNPNFALHMSPENVNFAQRNVLLCCAESLTWVDARPIILLDGNDGTWFNPNTTGQAYTKPRVEPAVKELRHGRSIK